MARRYTTKMNLDGLTRFSNLDGFNAALMSGGLSGSVELILNGTTVIAATDDGTHHASNLYDGDFTTEYISASTGGWAGIDLGSGVSSQLSAILFSPQNVGETGNEQYAQSLLAEYFSGSWTSFATTPSYFPFRYVMNRFATSPGLSAEKWRLLNATAIIDLSQLAFEGSYNPALTWKPARPQFTPAAGCYAAGHSITIISPTATAAIHYTLGYVVNNGVWATSTTYLVNSTVSNGGNVYLCTQPGTSLGSGGGPTGTGTFIADGGCLWDYIGAVAATATSGSTLYAGAISLPAIRSTTTLQINAIAYVTGATNPTSAMTTALFDPQEFVPQSTAVDANSLYLPQPMYDNTNGFLIEAHGGGISYDSPSSLYYWYGCIGDSDQQATGAMCYSSPDLYNWTFQGQSLAAFTGSGASQFQTRPHVLYNPSPSSGANKYVMWIHNGGEQGQALSASSSSPIGTFTYNGGTQVPTGGHFVGDLSLFQDAGGAWYMIVADSNANCYAFPLDNTTDNTTFSSGSAIQLSTGVYESPVLFLTGGYYYLIQSLSLPYNGTDAGVVYKSATTLAGLSSASFTTLWRNTPASTQVAKVAQPTCAFQPNGSSNFVLMFDRWIPDGSVDLRAASYPWWYVPPAAIGSGMLSLPTPNVWNLSQAPETPALVAHTVAAATSSSGVTTIGIDTTLAKQIQVSVGWYPGAGGAPTITLTDSKSNTWLPTPMQISGDSNAANQLFYCVNPIVGTGHTFTVNTANSYASVAVVAFSGVAGKTPDQVNGASVAQPGTVTPGANNAVIVSGFAFNVTLTSIDSGFTMYSVNGVPGVNVGVAIAYLIQGLSTTENPTYSGSFTSPCSSIASFAAADP